MGFLAGALIIDCILNSKSENGGVGSGILGSIILSIYLIYKLPKLERFLLNCTNGNELLIVSVLIGATILIPLYYVFIKKHDRTPIASIILRIILYLDICAGMFVMIMVINKLGSYPASLLFNIERIGRNISNNNFFVSTFSLVAYPIVKILDVVSVVALIPLIQSIVYMIISKIFLSDNN